jgi:hypothetical protein
MTNHPQDRERLLPLHHQRQDDSAGDYKQYGSTSPLPVVFEQEMAPPPTDNESIKHQRILIKTQKSFWQDARAMSPGSIPHSAVLALTIGGVCGVAAYLYYAVLEWIMDLLWHRLPLRFVVGRWNEGLYVLWIPLIGFTMAACLGLSVKLMGEPGDLPYGGGLPI